MGTGNSKAAGWALIALLGAGPLLQSSLSAASEAILPLSIPSNTIQTTGQFLLQDITESVESSSTRIEIQLNEPVPYKHKQSEDAQRIYLDMQDTRFALDLIGKAYALHGGPVEHVLLAHSVSPTTRLVLELSKPSAYSVQMLENPARLVIDIDTSKPLPKPRWRMVPPEEEQRASKSVPISKRIILTSTAHALPSELKTNEPVSFLPTQRAQVARQTPSSAEVKSVRTEDERKLAAYNASAEFELRPRTERSNLNFRRPTVQALYNGIASAYGIKLIFDPDVTNLQTQIVGNFEIENASLKEAFAAAEEVSKTFVSPVDEHTGIVASDTSAKRGEFERQVLASFQVDNNVTQQELTEITTALQTVADLRRIVRDPDSNRLSVLGRAHQVDVAGEFLRSLQKERGEVVVDMEILEVNSQVARSLGIIPPQTFQMLALSAGGAASSISLQALKAVQTLFGVQIPGASATLTYSSSVVRSRQSAQLRALSGEQATFTVGDRVPLLNGYVTSSFSTQANGQSSLVGSYPSIQYENVGLTLKATPYLHAGRELTLKFDLSLRGVSAQSVNGTPIISNRQVTEQIRLKDGETYLLGGILNRLESNSVNGYPWFSKIPILGSILSSRNKQKTDTELLLLIRPHVIRRAVAEEYASNAIYFGKELQGISQVLVAPPPTPAGAGPEGFFQPGAPIQRIQQQPGIQPGQGQSGSEGGIPVLPGTQSGAPGQQRFGQPGGAVPVLPGLPGQPFPVPQQQQHE